MSGPVYVIPDGTGHIATPKAGSYVRESDGQPATLTSGTDYPVRAECDRCGGRIRLAEQMQWEWRHDRS